MDGLIPALLVGGGLVLVLVGVLSGLGRSLGLGRLPGDVRAQRGPVRFYAPLGTSLLISVILTIVLNAAFCGMPR